MSTSKLRPDEMFFEIDFLTNCWNWLGAKTTGNYGVINRDGITNQRAHRYLFKKYVQDVPNNMELDHLCRNTLCVNPDHLEVVTHAENLRRAKTTRLKKDDIILIKEYWLRGVQQKTIAKKFGVSACHISRIVNNKKWKASNE